MLNTMKIAALSLTLTGLLVSATYGQIEYSPPTLDFGVPDLQGTWSYETRTACTATRHYSELEIDEATMLSTLEPTSKILDDYQNFGTNRQNDPANVGGYDPEYFSIGESSH